MIPEHYQARTFSHAALPGKFSLDIFYCSLHYCVYVEQIYLNCRAGHKKGA